MNEAWAQRRKERDAARRAVVLALPAIRVRHHARIVAAQQGDVRVRASVGPAGEVVVLWSAAEDVSALRSMTVQPGWATHPDPRAPRPVGVRVTVHAPDMTVATRIAGLPLAHPHVQLLPGGRVVVVGARCRWWPEGPDLNAIVYDAAGEVLAERTLGDGIAHVLATRRGEVWVGYFDEGVYGNRGWGERDSEPPLGACGLTRFSNDLRPAWRYPSHVDNEWGAISDCYALNVDGDTAWAYYYTGFPIVRIHNDVVSGWRNDVRGGRALAVGGARVALYGGYGPDHDRLVVGVLRDDRMDMTGEFRLILPNGEPLPAAVHVVGRGPDLHFLVDDSWLRLSIEDIPVGP